MRENKKTTIFAPNNMFTSLHFVWSAPEEYTVEFAYSTVDLDEFAILTNSWIRTLIPFWSLCAKYEAGIDLSI